MKWTRYLGYAGFFLASFIAGLYLTFPWDAAKERLLGLAETKTGMHFTAASLDSSWFTGVRAETVEITTKPGATPIRLDWVKLRVKLLSLITGKLGATVSLPLGKGEVDAAVVSSTDLLDVEAHLKEVQLDQVAFLIEMAGLPLYGKVDLDADLVLGKTDPKLTEGTLKLKTAGLGIEKGGKIGMIPVPNLELGNLELEIPIKEGKAELKKTRVPGTDLELMLDGTLSPQLPFSKTTLNLVLGLKPTEKLLNADPLLRPILKNFEQHKDGEGFFGVALTGSIQHPRMQPRRP
ncbi:MAG: type II secretion system protein GspN [Deltaproteobacteria bacterium]|nr:type II secretion system protein GspN [Deltaproteobacteria bacterium]